MGLVKKAMVCAPLTHKIYDLVNCYMLKCPQFLSIETSQNWDRDFSISVQLLDPI